jgi:predicted adenylyl cyclase CyaB
VRFGEVIQPVIETPFDPAALHQAPMPRNIEIKARIGSLDAVARKAAAVATQGPIEIAQDDTFFRCESGRLKLRAFTPTEGELIYYRRADLLGPKESFYVRTPTASPGTLRECLRLAYGEAGRVVKHRTLYLVGRTRVHLDRVAGLGQFLELEVVLQENEPIEAGIDEAHSLMAQLGVEPSRLIEAAYVDLLAQAPV